MAGNVAENKQAVLAPGIEKQAERINALVGKIDALPDKAARASAVELLQEVMELHASVLDRMLELAAKAGDPGLALIDTYMRDPLISGLLVLYDLHPETLETRLARALDKVRPYLQSHGGDVELLEVSRRSGEPSPHRKLQRLRRFHRHLEDSRRAGDLRSCARGRHRRC